MEMRQIKPPGVRVTCGQPSLFISAMWEKEVGMGQWGGFHRQCQGFGLAFEGNGEPRGFFLFFVFILFLFLFLKFISGCVGSLLLHSGFL